ncbi:hypothetical protein BSU04_09085 [Caballeronia sordidicola]|uniref:Uncharacterized protein n=1 Tax=Caballeronia sordidicola TaxID=196367 RepID=A0A226X7J7_CABSO|nr:hypothetical protein BSU04_09085 [Caballeronia sordidicola]
MRRPFRKGLQHLSEGFCVPRPVTPVTCRFPTMQQSSDDLDHATAFRTGNRNSRSAPGNTWLSSHFPHRLTGQFYHVPLTYPVSRPAQHPVRCDGAMGMKCRQLLPSPLGDASDYVVPADTSTHGYGERECGEAYLPASHCGMLLA